MTDIVTVPRMTTVVVGPNGAVSVVTGPGPAVRIDGPSTEAAAVATDAPSVSVVSAGVLGPAGPPGPPGVSGDLSYTHTQGSAATLWTVTHNLGKFPTVDLVDSGGNEIYADVHHVSSDQLTIAFSAPNSGVAYCN